MRSLIVLCGVGLLAAGAAAAADPPPAGGVPDLTGPRSLGLSAAIGIAAGNDGIYVNPGAIAARKRYSLEVSGLVDRRGAETVDQFVGGSIVDSQSSPVTAAVAYARASKGAYTGNLVNLAIAGPVYRNLYLGVSGKWLSLHGLRPVSAATADAGIFWQVSEYVSVGATGYNLVSIENEAVAPMAAGAGVAIGSDRSIQVTADWRTDLDRVPGKSTNRYAAGVEVLLGNLAPVRAGFVKDETLDTRWWSLGVGLVTRDGVALDVGYRQSLDDPAARTIAASLKLFLFQ